MQTQALMGITVHGGVGPWWISTIPFALLAIGWGAAAAHGKIRARRTARRFQQRMHRRRPALRIELVIGDITAEHVDVIVNAAKSSLMGGGGVDGAIHKAGGPAILQECRELRATLPPLGLAAGKAVSTTAGNLHADYVVHTVGPMYDPRKDQSGVLRSCYTQSLAEADRLGARTMAFPLISAGVYGWPKDDAVAQALAALRGSQTGVQTARLVFYDEDTYRIAQAVAAAQD